MITDDPIPPQFLHLFNPSKNNCDMAVLFLQQKGRKIESVIGDGNCLFRAFSFILCGDQGMHAKFCDDITQFSKQNKQRIQPYLMQGSVDVHLANMTQLGTWGTQVEIIANATMCQIPVYIATVSTDGVSYHWKKYSPLLLNGVTRIPTSKSHMELIHLDSCHFDPVVSLDQKINSEPIIVIKHNQGGIID